jgi:hypothetical protein
MAKNIPEPVYGRVFSTKGYPPGLTQAGTIGEMRSELMDKMTFEVSKSGDRTYFYSEKFDVTVSAHGGAGLLNNCHLGIRWLGLRVVALENNLSAGGSGLIKAESVVKGWLAKPTPLEVRVYDTGFVSAKSIHKRGWGLMIDVESNLRIMVDFFTTMRELCYNPNWEEQYLEDRG